MPKASARPCVTSRADSAWSLAPSSSKLRLRSVLTLRSTWKLVVPVVETAFLPFRSSSDLIGESAFTSSRVPV